MCSGLYPRTRELCFWMTKSPFLWGLTWHSPPSHHGHMVLCQCSFQQGLQQGWVEVTAPPGGEVCLPSVALRGKALLLPLGLTFSQLGYSQLVVVSHVNTHFSFLHLSVGSISRESNCSSRPRLHFLKKEQDIFHSEPGNKRHPMGPWLCLTASWETCHRH